MPYAMPYLEVGSYIEITLNKYFEKMGVVLTYLCGNHNFVTKTSMQHSACVVLRMTAPCHSCPFLEFNGDSS